MRLRNGERCGWGERKERKKKPSKGEKREEEVTGRIRWGESEAESEIEEEATGTWGERDF